MQDVQVRFALFVVAGLLSAGTLRATVGDVYVTNNIASTTNGSVVRITPSGAVSTLASGLSRPYGLAIDRFGNVYTSDLTGGTITRISPLGVVSTFASGLSSPRGMGFDLAGNLIVATASTLTQITAAGLVSTFDTGYFMAWDVTFDTDGTMYADDFSLRRIYKYDTQGQKSTFKTLTGAGTTYGLALNEFDDLLVTQAPAAMIAKVEQNGTQSIFATGSPFQPVGIDVYGGSVYVSSFNSVFKYTADGSSRSTLTSGLFNVGMLAVETKPIPEPTTALFGVALAGFCAMARRSVRRV